MVKEGYWFGLPLLLIAGGLLWIGGAWPANSLIVGGLIFLLLSLLVLNFFRDPERAIPADPRAIASPADGRVVEVRDEVSGARPVQRVSIFMSPFDVHVNRSPIAGTIEEVRYRKGRFRAAYDARASVENEQNIFRVRGGQGEVTVRQIAGVVARRIVFWKKAGDEVERGGRVGLIRFGSRVDVLLEASAQIVVRKGSRVRAGSSILGFSAHQDGPSGD
jgi:phosphatidylserine decarboxylase